MKINIRFFGQLTDIIGTDTVTLTDIKDTEQLKKNLQDKYPALINSKYIIAVNKKAISANTLLTDNCTVALLPPFSGG